jgi:hypothetical protein
MQFPCRAALIHTYHAVPVPCRVNSHIPCRAPAILRQCRVLRVNPRGSRKYPNCYSYSLTTFVELRVVAGRSRTRAGRPHCRLWIVDANSHILCHSHAVPLPRCDVALISRFHNGIVLTWHGNGMACVNQTRPHCVNQMGKTQFKPLAERHGRGTAWGRHGMCEFNLRGQLNNIRGARDTTKLKKLFFRWEICPKLWKNNA